MANPSDSTIVGHGSPERRSTGRPSQPPDARSAAIAAVASHAGRFPDLLPGEPETNGLEPRDAALAHAIHDAVVRRWMTLAALIRPHLRQPFEGLEPRMTAILLCGTAQLVLLDRIPPHAAVSESVAWAKRRIRPGAGGMVNAVLRRVHESIVSECEWTDQPDQVLLADGRGLQLAAPILPDDPIDRLSIQASCPIGLLHKWIKEHGIDKARRAALYAIAPPPIILNVGYAIDSVPGTEPHDEPGHAVFTGSMAELRALLASRQDIWVQDAAAGRAIRRAAEHQRPAVIVDSCAGRGTKTRQLAAAFPDARIIATDIDAARLKVLRSTFKDHDRVRIVAARDLMTCVAGQAELVLLDVPCSNTGVLARRPEAKYRFGLAQMQRLTDIQRQVMADSVALLSSKGAILYSTCSLEAEEDTEPLQWASQWHRFTAKWSQLTWPHGGPVADGDAVAVRPSQYHDGSFSALLVR